MPEPLGTGCRSSSTTIVSALAANVSDDDKPPERVVNATACDGDSDEPIPSINARTDGNASSSAVLASPDKMLPPEPTSTSDDVSHLPGCASSVSSSGR